MVIVEINQIPAAHPQPLCRTSVVVGEANDNYDVLAVSYSPHRAALLTEALGLLEQQDPGYRSGIDPTEFTDDERTHLNFAVAVKAGGGLVAPLVFTGSQAHAEIAARALRLAAEADPGFGEKVSQVSLRDRTEGYFPQPVESKPVE